MDNVTTTTLIKRLVDNANVLQAYGYHAAAKAMREAVELIGELQSQVAKGADA